VRLQLVVPLGRWVLRSIGECVVVSVRSWIEMPVSEGTVFGEPMRPIHTFEGNALIVYRGEKAYVSVDEPGLVDRIVQLPRVRRLVVLPGITSV
jgi:hypothetical protein